MVAPADAAATVPPALKPDQSEPSNAFLELYKMAVEMADRVSARRGVANAFFLSVQTAMLSVISIAATAGGRVPWWTALILALAGISISVTWWLQLRSYRILNGAKFEIINSVELLLPVRIFSDEWKILTRDSSKKWWCRHSELGRAERMVPWIFAALYAALFVGILST